MSKDAAKLISESAGLIDEAVKCIFNRDRAGCELAVKRLEAIVEILAKPTKVEAKTKPTTKAKGTTKLT